MVHCDVMTDEDKINPRDTRPHPLGPTLEHYWKVQRMARKLGVDLCDAMERDDLSPDHWADMVQRCRGCLDTGHCERFLSAPEDAPRPSPTCENKKVFAALALLQEDLD